MRCAPLGPPLNTSKAILRSKWSRARRSTHEKNADASARVILSQDEARFSLIPTLRTTLGGKGHRPLVGTLDCHTSLYLSGALNLVTGHVTTRLVARPRQRRTSTVSKRRYLQEAFAKHLRDIARTSPATPYPRVVLVVDNASWHQGHGMDEVLTVCPHLELYPLPSLVPSSR